MTPHPDFCDEMVLHVAGGTGGDGAVHFARFKYKPKGGPDGGDGGDGGSVFLVGDPSLEGLEHISSSRSLAGESGGNGAGAKKAGKRGADLVLPVPLGTRVFHEPDRLLMVELTDAGQRVRLVAGGKGGRGNARFATARNKAPRFAEEGKPGEEGTSRLVYRVYAPLALICDPRGEFSLARGLMGRELSAPHRFFQRPRCLAAKFGFHPLRAAVLPMSLERAVQFHFLHHLYYAQRAIINAAGSEGNPHFDAIYPSFIKAIQKPPAPSLTSLIFLAREDPGLPYEVEMEGQKLAVRFLEVPRGVTAFDEFWQWAEAALTGVLLTERPQE